MNSYFTQKLCFKKYRTEHHQGRSDLLAKGAKPTLYHSLATRKEKILISVIFLTFSHGWSILRQLDTLPQVIYINCTFKACMN